MRSIYRLLALLAIPLFFIRVVDLTAHYAPVTGFLEGGSRVFRLICIAVVVAVFGYLSIAPGWKKLELKPDSTLRMDSAVALSVSGILYLLASFIQIVDVLDSVAFRDLFRGRQELLSAGFHTAHFRIEFWCGVAGAVAAAWFFWVAVTSFSGRRMSENHPMIQLIPGLWFAMRTLASFTETPLNFYVSARLFGLFSTVLLGLSYVWVMRYYALGCTAEDGKFLARWSLPALLLVIGFHAPTMLVADTGSAAILYIAGDALAALAVFTVVDHQMKGAHDDEASEID